MPPKRNHHRSKTGRSKAAAAAADAMADCVLPSDIIFCILTRLPVKSLLRFKSVCKPWRKLFSTPNFIKFHYAHFSKLPQNNNFMIYSVAKAANHHTMSLFRIESDEEIPTNLDHPYPQFFLQMDFVGCCNGLICMAMPPYGQWIILWNPALKLSKHLQLPNVKFGEKESVSLGFCFDEEAADFKVVRIGCLDARKKFRAGIEVYSSNSDSWKKLKTDLKFRIVTTKCDAVVAGNPHWIVKVNENVSNMSHILWFDVKKMALKMAPSPDVVLVQPGGILPLMEWEGSLAVIVCHKIRQMLGGFRVIVFDEVQKVWNNRCDFGPIEMERIYRPLQCSKNGMVIGTECSDGKLFVIDPKTGRVKDIEIERAEMLSFKIHEYNESLVALDGMEAAKVVKVDDSDDDDDDVDLAESFKNFMQLRGGNFPMAV